MARRRLRPPLAPRLAGGHRLLRRRTRGAKHRFSGPTRPSSRSCPTTSTRARSTSTSGSRRSMLYTSGTTGPPKGVPRSHRAERAGGLSQAIQHGYAFGDRTLGVMPLYHTMGDHSLIAMSLIGGCFVASPTGTPTAALELVERERITLALPRSDALPRPRLPPQRSAFDLSPVRALGYAGAAMTPPSPSVASTRSSPTSSSTTTARRRSTPSRSTATSGPSPAAPVARRSTRGSGSSGRSRTRRRTTSSIRA